MNFLDNSNKCLSFVDGIKILWITGIDVPTAMIYKFVTRKNVKKAILD